jgi:hypothetical protein
MKMAGYKELKQKIDESAGTQLSNMAFMFPESWTEESRTLMGLRYRSSVSRLDEIEVEYKAKKQLLGGVYSLSFTGVKEDLLFEDNELCVLQYRGRFIKGEAFFESKEGTGSLALILNGDIDLIRTLSSLDILSMEVSCRDRKLSITLSPMGGAYTYTVFPPMKHDAVLPQGDLNRIVKALNRIAAAFPSDDGRKAAGAE